jgi:uncharacterized membrane protein
MKNRKNQAMSTKTMVLGAVMTAFVVILQLLSTYTTFFGPFSTAIALVPIIIGAALCGATVGAWLGLVFGIVVLATGGAALFWLFSIPGSIVTVLLKGAACGLAAGLVYRLLQRFNRYLAVVVASVVCPVVNTGVFLLGSAIFFLPSANEIAAMLKLGVSGMTVFWVLAMGNFLFEVGTCLLLSPLIVRLIDLSKK